MQVNNSIDSQKLPLVFIWIICSRLSPSYIQNKFVRKIETFYIPSFTHTHCPGDCFTHLALIFSQPRSSPLSAPDHDYCWKSESLDFILKDDNDAGDDQTLNRVTSLRLQQAYVHISTFKSQLVSTPDTPSKVLQ